jgi:hypothetical protein
VKCVSHVPISTLLDLDVLAVHVKKDSRKMNKQYNAREPVNYGTTRTALVSSRENST